MKAIIFCRVSSKEQEETGYSLPAQEKYLREYAERNNFTVEKAFAVSESASGSVQRKVFNEMVNYIRKVNIPIVIVETTDRLTRNFADVPTIDKWILENESYQIHLAKEACVLHKNSRSHEWFMWRVKVATAEYYVRLLSENVKKGQKEKIAQGWLPTKPPLGYLTIGEKGHKTHILDQDKSPLMKKVFELYATGDYSLKRLSNAIYDQGLRTDSGRRVVKSRIHRLLTDPFYIGKIKWNDEIHPGNQESLISEEVFYKVQSLLKSKTTPKYNKHNYQFKGLIRCKECAGTITWEIHKSIVYGHCNHYRNCSQRAWITQDVVESQVVGEFEKLEIKNTRIVDWIRKALKESHKDQIAYYSSVIGELNQKQDLYKNRLDRLYDDKLDGNISEDTFLRKSKDWNDELEKITLTIKKHNQASGKYFQLGINLYELSQRAKEIYLKAKDETDKRALINLVFSKLTLDEGVLEVKHSKTFNLLAEAVSLTNGSKIQKPATLDDRIFEPSKKPDITTKKDALSPQRPIWLRLVDQIRNYFITVKDYVTIPNLQPISVTN